jgi:hypothetical protein
MYIAVTLVFLGLISYTLYPYLYSNKSLRSISLLRIPITIITIILFSLLYYSINVKLYMLYESLPEEIGVFVICGVFAFYFLIGIFVRLNRYWQKK